MARTIDVDKAMEVAQIKYNDWNLAMAAADGQREINLCFKKQELFKAVKAVLECVPTLTPPNEWVSVEKRLPEDEARQYIKDELDGIGYLYPCLLTYKSPNTERIHVVRFYYDIIQKWFVNNGEELCEKGRCIAWMPLPAPPDRLPPEGEANG